MRSKVFGPASLSQKSTISGLTPSDRSRFPGTAREVFWPYAQQGFRAGFTQPKINNQRPDPFGSLTFSAATQAVWPRKIAEIA
jgi:hypothetical protein